MRPKTWIFDRRTLLLGLGLGLAVCALAYVCIVFPRDQGLIAPIWFANALAVTALLRTATGRWPVLAAFAVAGNTAANILAGDPAPIALGLSACNAIEYLTCSWALRSICGPRFDITLGRHLAAFLGAALGCSALAAVAAGGLLGLLDEANALRGLAVWIQADALGLLTVAPALLVLTQPRTTPIVWRETWTLVVLTLVTFGAFFVARNPMLFLIIATLALPTWRMGLPGAVAGCVIIAVLGATASLTGHGPIISVIEPGLRLIGLQVFLTACFLTSLPLAAARDEGERLKARLRGALDEARAARAEAESAAAVKSEFLANMSHELRTPLTSVVGFTRLAAEQPDLSPLSRGYVERVNEASRALLCAVNDILDFSKLEAGQINFQPAPMEVHALSRTALDLLAPQAAAKDLVLRLEDSTPPGLTILADPDRLRQVLLNLVGNAVKFTTHGSVTLRASYDELRERLTLEVADTGPGIPPDRLDRLFKRFSQVDGSLNRGHGGTGLGLAICKGVVDAMGGEIGVASSPGQGSRFFLTVPAPRATGVAAPGAPDEAEAVIVPGVRVLVTDDHAANRELVQLFLAAIGAEVTEAADGETAVQLAAHHRFDVILMDLRMPRMDGAEALGLIRSRAGPNRDTPILAFTADAASVAGGSLEAQGFDGVVAKPVEPMALISAIAGVLPADEVEREVA